MFMAQKSKIVSYENSDLINGFGCGEELVRQIVQILDPKNL